MSKTLLTISCLLALAICIEPIPNFYLEERVVVPLPKIVLEGDAPAGGDTKPTGGDTKPTGGDTKPTGGDTKPTDGGKSGSGGFADTIGNLAKSINVISTTWGAITSAFKTTKSDKLDKIINGTGFQKFSSSGSMNQVNGLKEEVFGDYLDALVMSLEVPQDKQKEFAAAMKFVQYSDSNTWNAYNLLFNKGSGGDCKYVALLFNHDTANKKYNIFVADIKATFDLAPDVAVITSSRSYAGGIYSTDEFKMKDIPRSMTEADITMLFNFFKIVSFKNFADMLGLKIDFPNIGTPSKPPAEAIMYLRGSGK